MIKIIIDKYLKNEPNISNEKEIKLSKEYEVLSENTSLFAKILNDNSTQSKLVKVNINSDLDKSYESDDVSSDIRYKKKRAIKKRAIKKSSIKQCAKKKCAKKKSKIFLNKKRDRSSDSGEISSNEEEISLDSEEISSDSLDKKKKKKISPEKSNNNIDLISLIISQDPIEGYWEKNKDTINVEKLVTKNIINNLKKICLKKKKIFIILF